jgi:hypothetical protein
MRYLLMIAAAETILDAQSPQEESAITAEYGTLNEELRRRSIYQDRARLRPTTEATTVQVRDREVVVADGPFAETAEQIGGIYLVECVDLDEAIEVASKIPHARVGTIEVRPIWEL